MSLAQADLGSSTSRIELHAQPTDVCFSPRGPVLAVGYITGDTRLLRPPSSQEISDSHSDVDTEFEREVTQKACVKPPVYYTAAETAIRCGRRTYAAVRSVLFQRDGWAVTTAHTDGSLRLFDAETGRKIKVVRNAHSCDIYRLENLGNGHVASGDNDGMIKFWDVRAARAVGDVKAHLDYITDLALLGDGRRLVASSGDTSVTVNDIRNLQTVLQSHDGFREEGTALQPLGDGDEFVCGTTRGKVALFSATALHKSHEWFSGGAKIHRGSIDAMVPLDDQTIVTGCADGVIRVLRFRPHRLLGVVGRHRQKDTVERLTVNGENTLLASIGLEDCVRVWDIQNLKMALERLDEEEVDRIEKPSVQERARKRARKQERIPNFFSDLSQV